MTDSVSTLRGEMSCEVQLERGVNC